jgi:hypothetical protein
MVGRKTQCEISGLGHVMHDESDWLGGACLWMNHADLYRKLAAEHSVLVKEASSPFLRCYHQRIVENLARSGRIETPVRSCDAR